MVESGLEGQCVLQQVEAMERIVAAWVPQRGKRDGILIDIHAHVLALAKNAGHVAGCASDLEDPARPIDDALDRALLLQVDANRSNERVPEARPEGHPSGVAHRWLRRHPQDDSLRGPGRLAPRRYARGAFLLPCQDPAGRCPCRPAEELLVARGRIPQLLATLKVPLDLLA